MPDLFIVFFVLQFNCCTPLLKLCCQVLGEVTEKLFLHSCNLSWNVKVVWWSGSVLSDISYRTAIYAFAHLFLHKFPSLDDLYFYAVDNIDNLLVSVWTQLSSLMKSAIYSMVVTVLFLSLNRAGFLFSSQRIVLWFWWWLCVWMWFWSVQCGFFITEDLVGVTLVAVLGRQKVGYWTQLSFLMQLEFRIRLCSIDYVAPFMPWNVLGCLLVGYVLLLCFIRYSCLHADTCLYRPKIFADLEGTGSSSVAYIQHQVSFSITSNELKLKRNWFFQMLKVLGVSGLVS